VEVVEAEEVCASHEAQKYLARTATASPGSSGGSTGDGT